MFLFCPVDNFSLCDKCPVIHIKTLYSLSNFSNEPPGNFNILAKVSNIQKMLLFQRHTVIKEVKFSNYHFDPAIHPVSTVRPYFM